jgi:hypothetical protein
MNILLQITKLELLLIARSKFTYIIAILLVFLGIQQATGIRNNPISMWGFVRTGSTGVSFILTFWALGLALRRQDKQVGKMIWATVSPSWVYILGKFLGVFCMVLLFSLLFELAAMVADQFWNIHTSLPLLNEVIFPPLGWTAFPVFWLWFMFIPVLFGAAFAIGSNYLTRGRRLIGYAIALPWWFIGDRYFSSWMDITATSVFYNNNPLQEKEFVEPFIEVSRAYANEHVLLLPQATHLMDILRATIPPYFLGQAFLANRMFFFLLSLLLLSITIIVVDRRRSATGG